MENEKYQGYITEYNNVNGGRLFVVADLEKNIYTMERSDGTSLCDGILGCLEIVKTQKEVKRLASFYEARGYEKVSSIHWDY